MKPCECRVISNFSQNPDVMIKMGEEARVGEWKMVLSAMFRASRTTAVITVTTRPLTNSKPAPDRRYCRIWEVEVIVLRENNL